MSLMINPTNHAGGEEEAKIDENDRIINSMQSLRESMLNDLVKGGKAPSDPLDRQFVTSLMDGATRSALASKKIKADKEAIVSQAQIVQNLAEAVRVSRSQASAQRRLKPTEVDDIPYREITKVPDHTAIGNFPISTSSILNAER